MVNLGRLRFTNFNPMAAQEVRAGRAVKRMRADDGSSVADRLPASGSHGEVSQLCPMYSRSQAAVSTAQTPLVCGLTGTHPWNTLVLDLQERILVHLPLQELGRAACLGKAFRSAFQQRALQVEQGLVSAGVATFGRPLLEGVGRVIQRYRQRTDVATGCGSMLLQQRVGIDRCGTIVMGDTQIDSQEPYAIVDVRRQEGTKDIIGAQDLILCVTGPKPEHWACLELSGPTRRCSPRFRNEAALVRASQSAECLGAMFNIAQQAGEESTCQNSGEHPQHGPGAHPVAPPFPGGGNSAQHDHGGDAGKLTSGNSFEASQAIPHPAPRRVAAGAVRRLCAWNGPMQQASRQVVEQGMITALMLAEGFKVPCCRISLLGHVRVFACENKWYCRKHRVRD